MRPLILAAGLLAAAPAFAAPEAYVLDSSHSQIVFSYNHLGFSTNYGMFSGFEGKISYDAENPAASSVEVSFPVETMLTGWQARFDHFMTPEFFGAVEDKTVRFVSTGIEVTGEKTAKITGDLP
jgi:polyisoprenoid-binding protein YceI